jgi:hypothetical protein
MCTYTFTHATCTEAAVQNDSQVAPTQQLPNYESRGSHWEGENRQGDSHKGLAIMTEQLEGKTCDETGHIYIVLETEQSEKPPPLVVDKKKSVPEYFSSQPCATVAEVEVMVAGATSFSMHVYVCVRICVCTFE